MSLVRPIETLERFKRFVYAEYGHELRRLGVHVQAAVACGITIKPTISIPLTAAGYFRKFETLLPWSVKLG